LEIFSFDASQIEKIDPANAELNSALEKIVVYFSTILSFFS